MKSTRNAGEDVKTVLANYKAQRDAVDKAHKALYEQERTLPKLTAAA